MKKGLKILLAAAALFVANFGTANAYMIDPMSIGNWEGGAYYNDSDRRFSHCAVGVNYQNNVYMIMSWDQNGLSLGFVSDRWNNFNIGSQTNMRIEIDDRWTSEGPADVVARGQLVTVMGREPRPVTAMRRGLELRATVGKETLNFQLTTTNAAIDALAQCYRRHS